MEGGVSEEKDETGNYPHTCIEEIMVEKKEKQTLSLGSRSTGPGNKFLQPRL